MHSLWSNYCVFAPCYLPFFQENLFWNGLQIVSLHLRVSRDLRGEHQNVVLIVDSVLAVCHWLIYSVFDLAINGGPLIFLYLQQVLTQADPIVCCPRIFDVWWLNRFLDRSSHSWRLQLRRRLRYLRLDKDVHSIDHVLVILGVLLRRLVLLSHFLLSLSLGVFLLRMYSALSHSIYRSNLLIQSDGWNLLMECHILILLNIVRRWSIFIGR